jgi:hypothetical protein
MALLSFPKSVPLSLLTLALASPLAALGCSSSEEEPTTVEGSDELKQKPTREQLTAFVTRLKEAMPAGGYEGTTPKGDRCTINVVHSSGTYDQPFFLVEMDEGETASIWLDPDVVNFNSELEMSGDEISIYVDREKHAGIGNIPLPGRAKLVFEGTPLTSEGGRVMFREKNGILGTKTSTCENLRSTGASTHCDGLRICRGSTCTCESRSEPASTARQRPK